MTTTSLVVAEAEATLSARIIGNRPKLSHLALFFVAYVLGCGFAQALAIVPGITVSIWPPAGLFIATLILTPKHSWPWWVLVGCLAEMVAQLVWFHSPLPAGFLIYIGNGLCAIVGATLVKWTCRTAVRLETMQEVLALVVLGAGVAPLVSATVGSATLAWFGVKSQTFAAVWPLFWIGDATGVLLVAPLTLVTIQHWRSNAQLSAAQWAEAAILGLILLGAAALALSDSYQLSPYIIMPPLLWVAVRFEFRGAAVALTLLALITVALTLSGNSQFVGDPESQRQKQVMLQLFLAISAFSALIVAAVSRQHQLAALTLQQSERSLRELLETLPTHIWCTTPDGKPIYFSKQFRDFVGFRVEDKGLEGASRLSDVLNTIIHPDDLEAVNTHFARSLATGEPYARKHRLRRFDGQYRWVETRAAAMRNNDGLIVQWNGVSLDIDDQVRLYSDIEEREAKIRRLVDSDIIGIVIWDLDGRVIDANDAFLRMVQYEREDLRAGIRWFDITPPEWQEVHAREEAEELARTGKMQAREKEYFRKDGSRVPVLIGAACFEGQSRQGVAYILDLTERKQAEAAQLRAEEALRRAQDSLARASQAASLSELSASIAHEVNQPLAAIVATSHACSRWLSADPPNLERAKITLDRIIRDANSASDVVSRIRALFRQSVKPRDPTTLSDVVFEARDLMLEEAARRHVRIEVDVESDLPLVSMDRVHIQQVLLNLIRNGMEAMDSVSSGRVLEVRVSRMGDAVQTEVGDCGPGIEFPDKIFEPFFTTKADGMGMGLAICRSIVESHRGRLWVEKNEPHGATFIFTLPGERKRRHVHE